ncbi:MAG: 2-amino-4-hydroxy-6-hydroxymethyldihydropteridine diphosphokinase [Candidatus Riflebacteria bacterium]|nr:2-amino-4-hydroxy-6-hydroxymethyldihydropteridine diphosphokinase [Candidatus Riflebacteria bacterium]
MVQVFIAIGANINPAENVLAAVRTLTHQVKVVAISTFFSTQPIGQPDQPMFYNGVLEAKTDILPEILKFNVLRKIENDLGRKRTEDKYAPRTIDLDLILYGDLALQTTGLILPDPEISTRPFLAFPLYELAPDLILPTLETSLEEIIKGMTQETMRPLHEFTLILRRELSENLSEHNMTTKGD